MIFLRMPNFYRCAGHPIHEPDFSHQHPCLGHYTACLHGVFVQYLRGDLPPEEVQSEGETQEESKVEPEAGETSKPHNIGVDHKDWAWEPSCHEVT